MSEDVLLLRMGFAHGLYTRDDVRTWVDREIGLRAVLPGELLELATIAHRDDKEIISLLKGLEGGLPELVTVRGELAVLGELYRRGGLSMATVINELCAIANEVDALPEDVRSTIYWLDGALDLAGAEYGTMQDVRHELEQFLMRYPFERHARGTDP